MTKENLIANILIATVIFGVGAYLMGVFKRRVHKEQQIRTTDECFLIDLHDLKKRLLQASNMPEVIDLEYYRDKLHNDYFDIASTDLFDREIRELDKAFDAKKKLTIQMMERFRATVDMIELN